MALLCPKCGSKRIVDSTNGGSKCVDCGFEWKPKKQQLGCFSTIFILFIGLLFLSKIFSLASDNSDSTNASPQNNEKKSSNYIVYSKSDDSYYLQTKSPTKDSFVFKCQVDKKKKKHLDVIFYHGKTIRYSYPLIVSLYGTKIEPSYYLDKNRLLTNYEGAHLQSPDIFLEDLYKSSRESDKSMSVHFSEFIKGEYPTPDNQYARFDLTGFEQIYNSLKDCK